MSRYTFTIYELLKNGYDIGLNDYEIFDEEYRPILNEAIINHYMFREICYGFPEKWKIVLNARMNLIMRNKYNELYKQKMLEFNPLYNIDITETYEHEVKQDNNRENSTNSKDNSTTSSEENTNGLAYSNTYPSENMLNDDIEDVQWADTGNKNKSSSSENSTINNIGSVDEVTKEKGNIIETYTRKNLGSSAGLPFSKAMIQYKQYIEKFRLDEEVINELSDLFITVWG